MVDTNFTEIIGFYGGITSIIGLLLMISIYTRKAFVVMKEKQKEQERRYIEIRDEITQLASKATSHQKRQDIYIYANSQANHYRHFETRIRMTTYLMHILSFIIILPGLAYIKYKDELDFISLEHGLILCKAALVLLMLGLLYVNIRLLKMVRHVSKLNDSYSEGFLNALGEHIKRMINDLK